MFAEITLDQLPVGHSATVRSLIFTGSKRRRMQDIGFIPGTPVKALQESPWGDIVAYGIRGAVVALRQEDAAKITVERK